MLFWKAREVINPTAFAILIIIVVFLPPFSLTGLWAMSTSETVLTVHLVMPVGYPGDAFRSKLVDTLHEQFKIAHPTIQIEINDTPHARKLAPAEVV